jgi:hypothetical protein
VDLDRPHGSCYLLWQALSFGVRSAGCWKLMCTGHQGLRRLDGRRLLALRCGWIQARTMTPWPRRQGTGLLISKRGRRRTRACAWPISRDEGTFVPKSHCALVMAPLAAAAGLIGPQGSYMDSKLR